MMIWISYWLILLMAAVVALYLCIDRYSHEELDLHNRELKHRMDQAEQESSSYETLPAYLKTKSTKSRIKNRPDL